MSVRRLAEEAVQPADFAFSNDNAAWAQKRIALYPEGRQQSAVIPLLMRAQEQEGWVSRAAIEQIAEMLSMPYIRVLEVATFYTQFQLQPVGTKAHVQVCGTTPCMLRGAEGLKAVCQSKIHAEAHHLNSDGSLSWEEVECAGACVNAPMVTIGMDTYEDLTPERLEEIIDAFAAGEGASVPTGPQNGRTFSAPIGGRTTLLEPATSKRKSSAKTSEAANAEEPTKPGRKRETSPEAAPAVASPSPKKVSQAEAESERKEFDRAAKANGKPNDAAREGATGAESDAGKLDDGASVSDSGTRKPRAATTGAAKSRTAKAGGTTKAAAPKAKPAKPAAQESAASETSAFTAPQGAPDDLKMISGVGPVLEKKLNDFGVTQFAQIAAFKKADINKLDDLLRFKGRIERDEWVKQAKALAKGGAEEYRRVFGKDPH